MQRAPDVTARRKNDAAANTTQTMSGEHLIGELEKVIEKKKKKEKPKENLLPEDDIVFSLPKRFSRANILNKNKR